MGAMITGERVTYECQPYTIDTRGLLRCGGCRDPQTFDGPVREVEKRRSLWDDAQGKWRDPTDDEHRARVLSDVGSCDGCGKHPCDFPVFTNTGRVIVEHVRCRIY